MDQIQEFVLNHLLLWGALAVVLLALIATELWNTVMGPKPLGASDAVRLINSDAVVVDVRAAKDFKKGHILNAVNVPLASIEKRSKEVSKDTNSTVLCYCATGSVAPQACAKLKKLGYHHAHALKGGINAWQSAGLPVTSK